MKIDENLKQDFILLGLHIKDLREKRNITIKELSKNTNIKPEYLKKIEKGMAYGVLIDKHLIKIATVFQIKLSEMFDFKIK